MKLRYEPNALVDIRNIHRYIEKRNPVAAARVVERIRAAVRRISESPRIGHIGLVPNAMEWVVKGLPYIVVYEIDEERDEVVILAVFHGRQDRAKRE
jgi:toxin ParE1/3/4